MSERVQYFPKISFLELMFLTVFPESIIIILRRSRHQTISLVRSARYFQLLAGLEVVHSFLEASREEEPQPGEVLEDVVPEARPGTVR